MDTDTLQEALLEEAEAIVRAEWLRLHDVQPRDPGLSRPRAELPTRHHPPSSSRRSRSGRIGCRTTAPAAISPPDAGYPARVAITEISPGEQIRCAETCCPRSEVMP